METDSAVLFYSHTKDGKYCCFSNFFPRRFTDGIYTYNCSEQYLMKKKQELFDNNNKELSDNIMSANDPAIIKQYGRVIKNFNEQVWNVHKFNIMYSGLVLKFSQNEELKKILVQTNGKKIYEASPDDKIWGTGFNKEHTNAKLINKQENELGENLLGLALEKTREVFLFMSL